MHQVHLFGPTDYKSTCFAELKSAGKWEHWNKAGDACNKRLVQVLLLEHISAFTQHYQLQSYLCHPADHTADFLPQKHVTRKILQEYKGHLNILGFGLAQSLPAHQRH